MQLVLLLDPSVTVTVIGCEPTATTVPAVGLCVITSEAAGVQLSEATTSGTTFGTVPWHPAPAGMVLPAGHVLIVGGTLSAIVTTVVQVLGLPAASLTVTVTVWGPTPRVVPAVGL